MNSCVHSKRMCRSKQQKEVERVCVEQTEQIHSKSQNAFREKPKQREQKCDRFQRIHRNTMDYIG